MYAIGNVLKSNSRTDAGALFVMVCNNGRGSMDQTETQFNAIVLVDRAGDLEVGRMSNTFNKGFWKESSLIEMNSK